MNITGMEKEHLTASAPQPEDRTLDATLRPKRLDDFFGQEPIRKNLSIFLSAAKQRGEPIEHVLLHGAPGLGKTTLAHVIANELDVHIRVTSGPAIERAGDLASILTNLEDGDILFIDEIHRLHRVVEEMLYPAMEDFGLDIILGKGAGARTVRLDLPRFSIIGATTRLSLLTSPLRSRFGATFLLDFYSVEEIEQILKRNAKILNVTVNAAAIQQIAKRSRRTPRVANRLLKRVRDFAQVQKQKVIDERLAVQALELLAIDQEGLDAQDRKLLSTIVEKFSGGPVGLTTLAAATSEESETIETVYEPFLLQLGFLERTARGRVVTERGYQHLGRRTPARQPNLTL
jgi:Holliday junction DNA helicase RuvB